MQQRVRSVVLAVTKTPHKRDNVNKICVRRATHVGGLRRCVFLWAHFLLGAVHRAIRVARRCVMWWRWCCVCTAHSTSGSWHNTRRCCQASTAYEHQLSVRFCQKESQAAAVAVAVEEEVAALTGCKQQSTFARSNWTK